MNRKNAEDKRVALATTASQNLKKFKQEDPATAIVNTIERSRNKTIRDFNRLDIVNIAEAAERIVRGSDQSRTLPPSPLAKKAGIPVARLYEIGRIDEPKGFGSGFLVSPQILITNHHIFGTKEDAWGCVANFRFEQDDESAAVNPGIIYKLRPDIFFYSNELLDFALVSVESNPLSGSGSLESLGFLPLIETKGKVVKGGLLNIIQYPQGGIKKYTTEDNAVIDIDDSNGVIYYYTDTEVGSSGSAGFNDYWEVAALHYTGVPETNENGDWITKNGEIFDRHRMKESDVHWICNAGKSVSKIVSHLRTVRFEGDKQKFIEEILSNSKDPLMPPVNTSPGMPVRKEESKLNSNSQKNNTMANIEMNFNAPVNIYINHEQPAAEKAIQGLPNLAFTGATEKKERFDEDYTNRPGYDEDFLDGFKVPRPSVIETRQNELYRKFGSSKPYIVPYYNYSLVMNKKRRMAMWVASNVTYAGKPYRDERAREDFGSGAWRLDPRIPEKYQIQAKEFYDPATLIDKGHLVRRDDNCWAYPKNGRIDSLGIEYANADTYHWTNCTPQHEAFNQDMRKYAGIGKWGVLENAIKKQLEFPGNDPNNDNKDFDQSACVLSGPVLADDDPEYLDIQYPLKFWKVFAINSASAGKLVYGFILSQKDKIDEMGIEKEGRPRFTKMVQAMQASLSDITDISGVVFDEDLHRFDVMAGTQAGDDLNDDMSNFRTGR